MADQAMREEFRIESFGEPISHYCEAVRFGKLLYISGMTGVDRSNPGGNDVVSQARGTFEKLKKILDLAGASFADVLKVTVYLLDVDDRVAINEVRKAYFGAARPASTLIGVKALALPDVKLEIEAVVGLPG